MEIGVEFMSASANFSLTATYEKEFMRTVSETTTNSTIETISIPCGVANDGKLYGLWQWIVETEDMSHTARAKHAVCRSGVNAITSPTCPWNACANSECTECKDGWAA